MSLFPLVRSIEDHGTNPGASNAIRKRVTALNGRWEAESGWTRAMEVMTRTLSSTLPTERHHSGAAIPLRCHHDNRQGFCELEPRYGHSLYFQPTYSRVRSRLPEQFGADH